MVIHSIVSVGTGPRESKLPRVGADGIQEGLEQGFMGGKLSSGVGHNYMKGRDSKTQTVIRGGGEEGEAMPAILFHGEEAPTDQTKDKGGVGVHM